MLVFCAELIELPAGVALNNHQFLAAGYQTWPASGTHLFVIVKAVKCTMVFFGLAANLPIVMSFCKVEHHTPSKINLEQNKHLQSNRKIYIYHQWIVA